MSDINEIQNFVFRGMLLDSTLGTLADSGLEVRGNLSSEEKKEENISIEDFPLELRSNALKMSKTYVTFFCFENSVRKLVADRLREVKGANWWEEAVSSGTQKKVKDRIEKDKKNKWHSPRAQENISYCDFGDLCDIIVNKWEHFQDLFPGQEWVKTRLNDLEPSRNALAHHNLLQEHDTKRIGMFLKDWILQVG